MKDNDAVRDPSSTGRKRGRKVLEQQGRPYWCRSTLEGGFRTEIINGKKAGCGRSPSDPSAPGGHYPGMGQLQVNHINKNVLDNDSVNLEWVCPSCHKVIDSQTEKGVSTKQGDEWGYDSPAMLLSVQQGEIVIRVVPDEEDS